MKVRIVDLFCGAGGTSTGAEIAAKVLGHEVDLTAVNHWTCAINTHSKNHPKAKHLCEPIELLKPRDVASAMSFPADYEFLGNKEEQVRQIGNAVPVGVATALLGAILATYEASSVLKLQEVA